MSKYVRVMDGLKSNANGQEFKLDEVIVADTWNTSTQDSEKMGGFNFSTEDKILRYIFRGDTLYDVIIPEDAKVVECKSKNAPHGIFRANKIIVTNPRPITEEMVIDIYKKSTLPTSTYFQCIYCLLFRKYINASKYIIKDLINLGNIDEAIKEFESFAARSKGNDTGIFDYEKLFPEAKEIYNILKEIQSPLDISLYVDKEPYIKELTDDRIINLTGQSGSGKSTYANKYFNSDEYLVIDTDDIFSESRYMGSNGINKELGDYFRSKYKTLPNCSDDFDLIYSEILEYCKKYDKTIVIDCAQFHCIKDISLLKGKLVVIRTCIDTCYHRTIERFKNNNPNYTNEEIEKFMEKKKNLFKWYKYSNKFIENMENRITLKKITNKNLELACKVQNEIFPNEDARQNYIEQINNDPYRKEMDYCIVYLGTTPIGVTGIYSYNEYPDDAWLGWFGILERYRKLGYGGRVLDLTINIAKEKGYKTFRLYTDEYAKSAHKLYESRGLIKEPYDRYDDKDEFFIADIYIYSISLTKDKVELWNNKFLGLKEQGKKENLYKQN